MVGCGACAAQTHAQRIIPTRRPDLSPVHHHPYLITPLEFIDHSLWGRGSRGYMGVTRTIITC